MGNCDVNDVINNVLNSFMICDLQVCFTVSSFFFFWVEKILFLELELQDFGSLQLQLLSQLSERRFALLFVGFRRFLSETL